MKLCIPAKQLVFISHCARALAVERQHQVQKHVGLGPVEGFVTPYMDPPNVVIFTGNIVLKNMR